MNILLLAYEGDTPSGYNYMIGVANALRKRGNHVTFLSDNQYYTKSSLADLSDYEVLYFDDVKDKIDMTDQEYPEDLSSVVTFINYHRLECWHATKSIKNYTSHVENNLVEKLYIYLNSLITERKIDCILFETVSSVMSYVAYYACRNKGIAYVGWIISRIPGRYDLLNDPFGDIAYLKKKFKETSMDAIDEDELAFITGYLDKIADVKPGYMKNNPMDMHIDYRRQYLQKLGKAIKLLPIIIGAHTNNAYYVRYPLEFKTTMFKYNMNRQRKIKKLKKCYDKIEDGERYFLFPMHFQPEASTGVNAPYYCDQAAVIKSIAFSLPLGVKLYVKDHPNGIGFLPMSTYEEILSLPNVKYINPESYTKELISKSIGVVTITSTMGYEALLMRKPVLTFGNVFYNYHPYCRKINGYDELPEALRSMISNDYKDFDQINIRFTKTYIDHSFAGNLMSTSEDDLLSLADNIVRAANREK